MSGADGYRVFGYDPRTAAWAKAALSAARRVVDDPAWQGADNLRHNKTWFVGVDALPNDANGSVVGVALDGPWQDFTPDLPLHPAQLSIVYEGYPKQDAEESDANHRYRISRSAAHVDGLLPMGPERRRYAQEFHAYILSLPLNDIAASPTVVWRGSHQIMQDALRAEIGARDPCSVDITEAYQAARRQVFAHCEEVPLLLKPGESALLHPFLLHGTQPWDTTQDRARDGRIIAFLRPEYAGGAAEWLATR